ncbi:MAG: sugar transferase, partial [Deltaproteobacteria bacterium]|nr:sugar transferase [Deltaproteobacteria bacterium]
VIGKDCVLDSGCTVTGSLIFPGSYVGEGLELTHVIVDKNRLINVRFGAAVSISENFILGGTKDPGIGHWLSRVLSQAVAALLLLLLWPVLLITALLLRVGRRGPVVFKKEALRLPAPTDQTQWRTFTLLSFAQDGNDMQKERGSALKHFLLRFLPGLINVAKGNLRIIGVSPRTEEDVKTLSQDWLALYLKTKAGLVSEAYINYGDTPTEDELYTAEAFYSVTAGIGHDLKLLFGYLGRVLKGFAPSPKA